MSFGEWTEEELLNLDMESFLQHCLREPYQGSGAGGQKRNRVYSGQRIRLKVQPELRAEDCSGRESRVNLKNAVHKLKIEIVWDCFHRGRVPSKMPKLAHTRMSLENPLYPLWLWNILVQLEQGQYSLSSVAEFSGLSSSALLRQMARDARLIQWLHQQRERMGLKRLKV